METSGFQNKVALVTGASSGIGSAVATRLGRAGATVAVHYNGQRKMPPLSCQRLHQPAAQRSSSAAM
jgi:NAD(P)-dependent dehydrogenase (short-subunit alcohol dehydrogenase family)